MSGYRASQRRTRQRTRLGLKIAGVAVAVAVLGLGVALLMARQSLQAAVSESHKGLDAALAGKQGEAAKQWGLATISFRDASHDLDQPWAKGAQLVPILAQHAKAVTEASKSGVDISRTATVAAITAPYRDLRSDNGQVNLPLIRKMQQPVADTQAALVRAKSSIAGIDTKWLVSPVASQLTEYRKQINRALPEADTAHQALMVAPGLLGGNGTRHYLILFSTPAESRYLGGFIGSWAELTASNGKLKITRHGRSGKLDDALPPEGAKLTGVDQFLARYSRFSPESFFQNVSASPDFPTVDKVASQLYPQAGGEKVDGTMYVDPIALAALLKLSGPVHVDGLSYPLTSSNAAQFLLHDQYTQFPISSDRTDFLSAASTATFDALTKRKLPTVPHITDTLDPIVRQHRLLFISHTPSELAFLQRIGLKGALPNPDGSDFLSVRTSNGNPNKIDYYLHRIVQDSVRYDPRTGYVERHHHRLAQEHRTDERAARLRHRQRRHHGRHPDRPTAGVEQRADVDLQRPGPSDRHHRWQGGEPGGRARARAQRVHGLGARPLGCHRRGHAPRLRHHRTLERLPAGRSRAAAGPRRWRGGHRQLRHAEGDRCRPTRQGRTRGRPHHPPEQPRGQGAVPSQLTLSRSGAPLPMSTLDHGPDSLYGACRSHTLGRHPPETKTHRAVRVCFVPSGRHV